jgi:hypothetical protein
MWLCSGAAWDRNLDRTINFCQSDGSDEFNVVPRIISTFCANTIKSGDQQIVSNRGIAAVWVNILSRRWTGLLSSLWEGNEAAVFHLLSGMFREDFIWGLTYGSEVDRLPHSRPLLALNILGALVEMAEALGVARNETPEQGVPYYEIRDGGRRIAKDIERVIGTGIGFPPISAAYGIHVEGRLLIQGQLVHVYAAWRIKYYIDQFFESDRLLNIVEIGGGYGGLCYWLQKICKHRIASYSIVDLPSTGVVQAYFLSRALGSGEAVALYDSKKEAFDNHASIRLIPHTEISAIKEKSDIVINQDSFPELPESEVDRYLEWVTANAQYFVSLNQEAYSLVGGIPQVWVADRCAQHAGFERVSRIRSWVRNGYVEEVYRIATS